MNASSEGSATVWAGIAGLLRAEIADGARRPGDRLPTEAALSARSGADRRTVRRALASLVEEGPVRTRRGAGAFAAEGRADYPIGARGRYRRSMEAAERVPGKRILPAETRPGTAAETGALRLGPGALVHVCEGLALADGAPAALSRSIYAAGRPKSARMISFAAWFGGM